MSEVSFPWYDSPWLSAYVEAKAIIVRECPHNISEFDRAMDSLRAPNDFKVRQLSHALDIATLAHLKKIIGEIRQEQLEQHELFGIPELGLLTDARYGLDQWAVNRREATVAKAPT